MLWREVKLASVGSRFGEMAMSDTGVFVVALVGGLIVLAYYLINEFPVSESRGAYYVRMAASHDSAARSRAARILRRLGPRCESLLPSVLALVTSDDGMVRVAAIGAVGRIGIGTKHAVDELIRALQASDGTEVIAAISLGRIGSDAVNARESLLEGLGRAARLTDRLMFAESLWRVTHDAALAFPTVLEGLSARNYLSRRWSLKIVKEIGSEALPFVSSLR